MRLCNGFTSFQTGFSSLSIDFVFFFSSEREIIFCEYLLIDICRLSLPLDTHFKTKHQLIPYNKKGQDTHTSNNPRIHLKPFCPLLNESFYLNWHSSVYTVWQEWRWGVRGLQVSAFLRGKEEKRQASTPAANDDDDDTKKTAESNWGWLPGSFPLQEEKPFFVNNSSTYSILQAWSLPYFLCMVEMLCHVGKVFSGAIQLLLIKSLNVQHFKGLTQNTQTF